MLQNVFYFLSFLAILSAIMVVISKSPVHSVLFLVITFFAIAGHYVLLNAHFLAAVHIIVYAGAIMVLFLYVIMMLNLNAAIEPHRPALQKFGAVLAACLLMIVLVGAFRQLSFELSLNDTSTIGTVRSLGKVLFHKFMFPFEVASILLLAAMVGAVLIAKKPSGGNEMETNQTDHSK